MAAEAGCPSTVKNASVNADHSLLGESKRALRTPLCVKVMPEFAEREVAHAG